MTAASLVHDPAFVWHLFTSVAVVLAAAIIVYAAIKLYRRLFWANTRIDLEQDAAGIARSVLQIAAATPQPIGRDGDRPQDRRSFRWQVWHGSAATQAVLRFSIVLLALLTPIELVANDNPLLVAYKGLPLFPVFRAYPETRFGGAFETGADYRDPYLEDLISRDGWVIWPPVRYSYATYNLDLCEPAPAPPRLGTPSCARPGVGAASNTPGHPWANRNWLGTDEQGRDVLARTLYGARIYVYVGLAAVALAIIAGLLTSALRFIVGFRRQSFPVAVVVMRSLPALYILMVIMAVLAPSATLVIVVLAIYLSVAFTRDISRETLICSQHGLERASLALGEGRAAIWRKHLWPVAIETALVRAPQAMIQCIGFLFALDFLGYGLPPGSPSLGEMLDEAKSLLMGGSGAWWVGLPPLVAGTLILIPLSILSQALPRALMQARWQAAAER